MTFYLIELIKKEVRVMELVKLGNDNIPSIAIGTWSWGTGLNGGNKVFGNSYGFEELFPVFQSGMENGLTLWDTAPVYGMGASENILGRCIKQFPNVNVSTKFTPLGIQSSKAMQRSFDKSIERLHRPVIDIYWIHNASNVEKWINQSILLYKEGKIKHIGVSNHSFEQVKEASHILEANGIHLDAVQNHYSLLYRNSEEKGILKWCNQNDTKFFAYMVLEQGALTGCYHATNPFPVGTRRAKAFPPDTLRKLSPLINSMKAIGEKYQSDVSQIAIAWAMRKGTIPLVGATKVSQIESICMVDKIMLTQSEIELLEQQASATGISVKAGWE